MLDYSALGADAGVTHSTARGWLSLLEAGYVLFRLERAVVYGGTAREERRGGEAVPLTGFSDLLARFDAGEYPAL